jgi:hypothetical protein
VLGYEDLVETLLCRAVSGGCVGGNEFEVDVWELQEVRHGGRERVLGRTSK